MWGAARLADLKRLPAMFYGTAGGHEPVRDWLKIMDKSDRLIIGQDIATAEFGWPIGMPVCRPLGLGLYEIRSDISHGRTARVLFCITDGHMVLLHGFVKKAQKTPKPDLDLAMKRKRSLHHE
jgi:phage-related protein